MNYSSRWRRYSDRGAKGQAVGLLALAIIILIIFIIFGFPLLLNLASKILSFRPKSNNKIEEIIVTPDPPRLISNIPATRSAQFTIYGHAPKDTEVELFLNDISLGFAKSAEDGSFKFEVDLIKGRNLFQAKAKRGDKDSVLSYGYEVYLLEKEPKLIIDNPKDGDKTDNNFVEVTGITDLGTAVTINNRLAVVNNDGTFKLKINLKNGDNLLTISAKDNFGTETKKEVKITSNY